MEKKYFEQKTCVIFEIVCNICILILNTQGNIHSVDHEKKKNVDRNNDFSFR